MASDPAKQIHAPFDGNTPDELDRKVDDFLNETGINGRRDDIRKGAFLAQDDQAFNRDRPDIGLFLSPEEKADMELGGCAARGDLRYNLYSLPPS